MEKNVLIERNGTQETIKMPIDFIDQLSKFEKSPCKHKNAVCNCGRFRIGEYRFRIKRFGSCLMMVKKIKYFDEAKPF
jgi:regulator of sigma E protease